MSLTVAQVRAVRAHRSHLAMRQRRLLLAERLMCAAPIAFIAAMAFLHRWTFDDGFIYFRTVDQILAGNGPVFNAGERVETFTSPLWMTVLTVGDLVSPLRLEYTAVVLSIGCVTLGLCCATVGSARLAHLDRPDHVRLPLGLIVFAALWPVWVWATGGLEIGLAYAWLGLCLLILSGWATSRSDREPSTLGLIVLGLGWLVRPELALSSTLFVGVVVVMATGKRLRARVAMLAKAFAIPLAYEIFRMGYYGLLVSTPAIAKEGTMIRPGYGWRYLANFVTPYLLFIPLLAIAFGVGGTLVRRLVAMRRHRALATVVVLPLSGVAHAAGIVLIGGDYIHARLLLPALFAILAPVFVVPAVRCYLEAIVVTAGWAIVCLFALRPPASSDSNPFGPGFTGRSLTYEDRGFERRGADQPWTQGPGLYLMAPFYPTGTEVAVTLTDPERTVVVSPAVGVNSYVMGTDVYVIDLHGLGDPLTAHQRLTGRLLPGHEKLASGSWLAAEYAAAPAEVRGDELSFEDDNYFPSPGGLQFMADVAWAQAALDCGRIADLRESSRAPMTVGRFVRNLVGAPINNALRIDRDPQDAYVDECGSHTPPAVQSFYDRVALVSQLPASSSAGDVAVFGECAAVFIGTGSGDEPWTLVEAPTHSVAVHLDASDSTPRNIPLFTIGPYGSDAATTAIETDGAGNYRVSQAINWFPPALRQWEPVPPNGTVTITLTADIDHGTWVTAVDGQGLATLPITAIADGASSAVVPQSLDDGGALGALVVEHQRLQPSATCAAILEHRRS